MRSKKKDRTNSFTLAETLITLAIIGIVASLTVPTLIKNYQKHEMEVRLKKVYTIFSQAANSAIIDHGPIKDWEAPLGGGSLMENTENFTKKYILPYVSVIKYCSRLENSGKCTDAQRTGQQAYYDGIVSKNGNWDTVHLVLKDGTFVAVSLYSIDPTLYVDLNGDKGPNVIGKDLFLFCYGIEAGWNGKSSNVYNKFGALNTVPPRDYTYKVIRNGWKIPDSY